MNDWYQRMVATLQLNGKGEPTQKAYTRSVRMLCEFYDKSPDLISEPELQQYFLQRKNVNHWSPKTMRICYCGIRFFYVNVLERDWHILSILRAQNEHRLPTERKKSEASGPSRQRLAPKRNEKERPWQRAASRAPLARPSGPPVFSKKALRSIPCATPTLPISSKPASTRASSNATWAMHASKPPCSIST